MMVEQYSVPEGPLYPPNSYGPGYGPSYHRSAFVKAEDKMGELLPAYQADTPPDKFRPSSSDWTTYLELGGCWFDDVNIDESIGGMGHTPNMYDFDNILTPDMTPPHHDFGQSDCMDEINDVLSSLSSHSSLSELPFAADNPLDVLLPTYSPALPDMSVVSPPPIIHPHTKPPSPLTSPPPATSTPCKPKIEQESSEPPACTGPSAGKVITPASGKRKSSANASTSKRRRLTEPRKQRKREQNKTAALKYRSRKKQEKLSLDKQQAVLEQENERLYNQVKQAEEEIAYLKSMLHEVCASSNVNVSDLV